MPDARGKLKKVGEISQDTFWLAFSKKHAEGRRMADIFEAGLQSIVKSGRYAELEAKMRRSLGL